MGPSWTVVTKRNEDFSRWNGPPDVDKNHYESGKKLQIDDQENFMSISKQYTECFGTY